VARWDAAREDGGDGEKHGGAQGRGRREGRELGEELGREWDRGTLAGRGQDGNGEIERVDLPAEGAIEHDGRWLLSGDEAAQSTDLVPRANRGRARAADFPRVDAGERGAATVDPDREDSRLAPRGTTGGHIGCGLRVSSRAATRFEVRQNELREHGGPGAADVATRDVPGSREALADHVPRDVRCDEAEEAQTSRVVESVGEVRRKVIHTVDSLLPPAPLFSQNGLNGFIDSVFNTVLRSGSRKKPQTPPTPSFPVRTVDILGLHGAKENGGETGDGIGTEQGDELRERNSHATFAEGEGQAQGESLIHRSNQGARNQRTTWSSLLVHAWVKN
jgi:hypothetical protein